MNLLILHQVTENSTSEINTKIKLLARLHVIESEERYFQLHLTMYKIKFSKMPRKLQMLMS